MAALRVKQGVEADEAGLKIIQETLASRGVRIHLD
jgi:hypothetical protein